MHKHTRIINTPMTLYMFTNRNICSNIKIICLLFLRRRSLFSILNTCMSETSRCVVRSETDVDDDHWVCVFTSEKNQWLIRFGWEKHKLIHCYGIWLMAHGLINVCDYCSNQQYGMRHNICIIHPLAKSICNLM